MTTVIRASAVRARRIPRLAIFLVAGCGAAGAIAQDTSARDGTELDDLRSALEVSDGTSDDELRQAFSGFLESRDSARQQAKQAESTTVNGVSGSVSAAARCAEGYVSAHRVRQSADDVTIASERRTDCDAAGCKAVQVDARRESPAPFSLSVSVSCAG